MMVAHLAIASIKLMAIRVVAIVVGLALWFLTQYWIGKRATFADSSVQTDESKPELAATRAAATLAQPAIFDGIHHLTRRTNRLLLENQKLADGLLISSSAVIDLLGGGLIVYSIIGPTFQAFLGMLMLFGLRQICQAFCPLPPPEGMIWRSPGFPTVLVTYSTTNDLFFSGHTAIAVFGALWLAGVLGPIGWAIGIAVMVFEIATVLLLRAHYTMDVFTGIITALYVNQLAIKCGPGVDRWLAWVAGG